MIAGRYQILEPLGEGGMGAVYIAVQHPLGRKVALKVLRPPNPEDSAHIQERFLREARAAARLNHPNVVTVHDFGIDEEGRSFLVMEWVQGSTLRAKLKSEAPFSWRHALAVTADISRALRAAHEHGIVHRDLKPENVIWDQNGGEGRARVLDFGLAKLHDDVESAPGTADAGVGQVTLTQEGIFLGTPGYAAPEFATQGISDDPRLDLYAVGVMLFEMLTGRAPFEGKTALSVMLAHVQNPVPLPTVLCPQLGIPPAVDALVVRLMQKDPAKRPASADVLLAEVQHLLERPSEAHAELSPDSATEASEQLYAQLQSAVQTAGAMPSANGTPSTPPTGSYQLPASEASSRGTFSQDAADASPSVARLLVPPSGPQSQSALQAKLAPPQTVASRKIAGFIAAGVLLCAVAWGWLGNGSSADGCMRGDVEACMQEGARLLRETPADSAKAFQMFAKACELGQSQACEKRDGPWPGGVLRRGFLGERGVMSPYEMRTGIGPRIARHVMEPFVQQDKMGQVFPGALAHWELDASGLRLLLRPDARKAFHAHPRCFPAGRRAQLEDYRFSVELAVRSWPPFDLPIQGRDAFVRQVAPSLEGLRLEDGDLVLVLDHPVTQVEKALSQVWLVPVLQQDCDNPMDWQHPVGTGDFQIVDTGMGGWTSLKRVSQNEHGVPHVDGIDYVPVGDAGEAMSWVRAGRLEIVEMSSEDGANLLQNGEPLRLKGDPPDVSVGQSVLTGMVSLTLLELNARRVDAFRDPAVRRAVRSVIDPNALPIETGGNLANGRFLPPWALGYGVRAGQTASERASVEQAENALARLRKGVRAGTSLKLGYAVGLDEIASVLITQLEARDVPVVAIPIAHGERINIGESFDLYLERIRYRARGQDAGGFLSVLPSIFRHFGHVMPSVQLLTEMVTSQRTGTARELSTADLEWELIQAAPAIPLLFGPKSERDKLFLFSPRVGGFVDDATKRVVRGERDLWLMPSVSSRSP